MKSGKALKATTATVMEAFGVTRRTVTKWVKAGCPHIKAPAGNRFDLRAVQAWRSEREAAQAAEGYVATAPAPSPLRDQLVAAKLRKELAQARRVEILASQLEEKLIDRADVEQGLVARARALRASLIGAAPRLAPILAPMDSVAEIDVRLRREFELVLAEFVAELKRACLGEADR